MKNPKQTVAFTIAAGTLVWSSMASAASITWTDWTTADATSASGTAGDVAVTFTGVLNPVAQTAGGINYWANNSSTYTSPPTVDNAPPDSDVIRLNGGSNAGTQTITFSQAVTNPVMAILSLGQGSVFTDYVFGDENLAILNVGPGYFGNGTLQELAGEVLRGNEGHGLIQFIGTYTKIDWTVPTAENWHGFQIGYTAKATVPNPSVILLIGLGLAGLWYRFSPTLKSKL